MTIADLAQIAGRTYPARRRTQNLVGGASPIQATNFSMGHVTLEPNGGQVPWHNQEQEEIYFIVEGTGEMCLGDEKTTVTTGQAVYIPHRIFHQLTNTGATPAAHDLLLRTGRRRRALAPGAGWHAAARGNRSAAAARQRLAAVHGETGMSMSAKTVHIRRHHHERRHRTHGPESAPAPVASTPSSQQGGVRVGDSESDHAEAAAGGTQRRPSWRRSRRSSAACPGPPIWMQALANPDYSIYFDAQTTDRRADCRAQGHRRRQAHLLREADRQRSGDCARAVPAGEEGRA